MSLSLPRLGVAICTFNSADVILDCLETLLAAGGVALDVVVADNASTDGTPALLRAWAAGGGAGVRDWQVPPDCPFAVDRLDPGARPDLASGAIPGSPHRLRLVETGVNGGFAAGVNAGLALLARDPGLDRFWILNPDSLVPPGTAAAFATEPGPAGGFALMGGRVLYCDGSGRIQIDGGTIDRRTGVTGNLNLGAPHATTPAPDPGAMDFITGASMVASRRFHETAGPMPEDYFLYYEEVDWALCRGALPLAYCAGGIVYHRAGTAIGSPTLGRPASPFSLYFKHRGRLRFVRRHLPRALPGALAYSLAKAAQLALKGYAREAATILGASLGRPPSATVRARLSPGALARLKGG
jgi:GT2 family glycosyltransferase